MDKTSLRFVVRKIVVPPEKVDRWMKRNNIPSDALFAPSPTARKYIPEVLWLGFAGVPSYSI
jgi:hypothetical protein